MEDFFVRALAGGVGVALAAGPIGCFVVWRRMAYFGATIAHAALLGVAVGFLLNVPPVVATFALCLMIAGCLVLLERQQLVSPDALLGVLAHAVFAAGLVVLSTLEQVRVDLIGYLFGDILAIRVADLWLIFGVAAVTAGTLAWKWNHLLAATVNRDLAVVEGVPVHRANALLIFLIAGIIAIGMKVVGMLLIVSMVVIPAAAARRLSATPERMALAATSIGVVSVAAGLFGSLRWDVPAGPSIVLAASVMFAVSFLIPVGSGFRGRR